MAESTKVTIEYVAKVSAAERGLKNLSRAERSLVEEFRDGNRTYDQAKSALKDLVRTYDSAEQSAESYRNAIKALRNEQALQSKVKVGESRFESVSRKVAAAGDVQSNLGAASGLAGAAGLGGLSQGLSISGELVVLVEELPRLKASLQAMPAAAQAAAQALGFSSTAGLVGALGITAIAVGAVVIAFNAVKKSLEGVETAALASINAEVEFNRQLSDLTSEQIDIRLQAIEIERNAQKDSLAKLEAELDAASEQFGGFITSISFGKIIEQEKELKTIVAELGAEEAELTARRNDAVIVANDAALAEEKLAASRASAALQEAQYAAQSVALQQEVANFDEEQLAARRQQLEERRAQLQAELTSLQKSGDTSENVAGRIDQLTSELQQLGKDLAFLNSASVKTSAASNAAKAAQEKLETTTNKLGTTSLSTASKIGQATQQIARDSNSFINQMRAERDRIKERVKSGGGFAIGGSSGSASSKSGISPEYADINRRRTELAHETDMEIYRSQLNLHHQIQDLQIDQRRAFEDAARTGSALSLRDVTRDIRRSTEDARREQYREETEILKREKSKQAQLLQEFEQKVLGTLNNINTAASKLNQQSISFGSRSVTSTR